MAKDPSLLHFQFRAGGNNACLLLRPFDKRQGRLRRLRVEVGNGIGSYITFSESPKVNSELSRRPEVRQV
jgi:hypothetical protein